MIALAETNHKIDVFEAALLCNLPPIEAALIHRFTPGLYSREIFMPAGSIITSKIHLTEHQYVVLRGRVAVFIPGVGMEEITGPYSGITRAGTRRILFVHEDTVWITFHPTVDGESSEADLGKIEDRIIDRRELCDGRTAFEYYQDAIAEAALEAL